MPLNVVASLIVKPSLDRLPTTGKVPPDDACVACLHINVVLAPLLFTECLHYSKTSMSDTATDGVKPTN